MMFNDVFNMFLPAVSSKLYVFRQFVTDFIISSVYFVFNAASA